MKTTPSQFDETARKPSHGHSSPFNSPNFAVALYSPYDDQYRFLGTAIILSARTILTCWHVVDSAPAIFVRVESRFLECSVEEQDESSDLALLRVTSDLAATLPVFLTHNTPNLRFLLWLLSWGVFGFAESNPRSCSKYLPKWKMPSTLDNNRLRHIQVDGGIENGCSGGPALLSTWTHGTASPCFGVVRLGGSRAAASQIIAADVISEFLTAHNQEHKCVHQNSVLCRVAAAIVVLVAVVAFCGSQLVNVNCGRVVTDVRKDLALETKNRPRMLIIEPGTFDMGSPRTEENRVDTDETSHRVTLTRRFAIAETETTQRQYLAVTGINPLTGAQSFKGHPCADYEGLEKPVICVSWYDAVEFCNRLSTSEGLNPAYSVEGRRVSWNQAAYGYRLPTEAEWEYAARAGSDTKFVNGNRYCDLKASAWFEDNSERRLQFVAKKYPNRWGLYDMAGNVWEWVWDVFGPFEKSDTPADPTGRLGSGGIDLRVWRGGSWFTSAAHTRTAYRFNALADHKLADVGFRIARTVSQ